MSIYKLSITKSLKSWFRYKINRKYKDRLFCLIFGSEQYKDKAVSLYNALNSSNCTADELEIYSIDDFIYINHKNDAAYLIRSRLPLYEHQSTINPNMPIRGLIYYGELYSKYITLNDLRIFGGKQVPLPTPQYVVFYNGESEAPAIEDLHLSDAFIKEPIISGYEWTARVINLNSSDNKALLDACRPLSDYCIFNEKVRKYSKILPREAAVNRAVNECIEDGILADVLLAHKAEVLKMIFTENQEKRFLRHFREEVQEETTERVTEQVTAQFMAIINDKDVVIAQKENELSIKDKELSDKDDELTRKDDEYQKLLAEFEEYKKSHQ